MKSVSLSFIKFVNFYSLLLQIIILHLSLSLPFWDPNTGVLEPAHEHTLRMELTRMKGAYCMAPQRRGKGSSRSIIQEHGFQSGLSGCDSRAYLLHGMWDLPRLEIEPVSPALAGRFLITGPSLKSLQKTSFWELESSETNVGPFDTGPLVPEALLIFPIFCCSVLQV